MEVGGDNELHQTEVKSDVDGTKKRRKRLACKGSFKSSTTKLMKTGGQPMPGVTDFPTNVPLPK